VAVTRDLSATGLGLLHTKPVKAKYLRVTIPMADKDKQLTIGVLRCEPIGRFWDVGGRFVGG